ncbi:MAG: hypothetical protein AB7O98_04315 [Hyphomonadaceae bacterium]
MFYGADFWGVAGAMFAVAAGMGLLAAAITLFRRRSGDDVDFNVGYNALAHLVD